MNKTPKLLSKSAALKRLREAIKKERNQNRFAKTHGLSRKTLNHALLGKRELNGEILASVNLRQFETLYYFGKKPTVKEINEWYQSWLTEKNSPKPTMHFEDID